MPVALPGEPVTSAPAAASALGYRHHHPDTASVTAGRRRALWWALGLNAAFMVVELVGALVAGSLALAADAVHMGSDVAALAIALVALRLSERPPTARYTFGWHRADIVAAQLNAVILLAASAVIVVEAIRRIGEPAEIVGQTVIVVAIAGLAVNVIAAVILSRQAGRSLNMRAALWHMASDALGSVAALGAGVSIVVAGAVWADLAASLFIAALVAVAAWRLLRDTTRIVLEGAPAEVDLGALTSTLNDHPGVASVHHLHVWSLDTDVLVLSAHVVLADEPTLHDAQRTGDQLRELLGEGFGITHATLEYECHSCEPPDISDVAGSAQSPDGRTSDPGAADPRALMVDMANVEESRAETK